MRKLVDWESVELRYRAGTESLRSIAAAFDITEGAIRLRAKKEGWARDLEARVRQATEAALLRKAATHDVRTERQVVEGEAEKRSDVVLAERSDIARYRKLAAGLIEELEKEAKDSKTLSIRTKIMKDAADTLKTLIGLERTAFNLDSSDEPDADAAKQFIETMLLARQRAASR